MTTVHTVTVKGGPLNDHEPEQMRDVEVEGDERLDVYVAVPGVTRGGELVEPPLDPPPGIKAYRRTGTIYTWS